MQTRQRKKRTFKSESLEPRCLLTGNPIITEFMAANDSSLFDEDGEPSDWIEIYNPTPNAINLDGWSVTDDAERLDRWKFPSVSLDSKDYLVIFASNKDRQAPDQELHTNFKLRAAGEYLALVNPAGEVVQDFGEIYPEQNNDVSYGLPIDQTPLLKEDANSKYRVPTHFQNDLSWTTPNFDDANWRDASGGIGFDNRITIENSGFETGDFTGWETHGGASVVTDVILVEPTEGTFQGQIDNFRSQKTQRQIESFLNLERNSLDDIIEGNAQRGGAIKRSLTVHAGDKLELDWQLLTNEVSNSGNKDFATISITPGPGLMLLGRTDVPMPFSSSTYLRGSNYKTFEHTFEAGGTYTIGFSVMQENTNAIETTLLLDNLTINGGGEGENSLTPLIQTDVTNELFETNSSIQLRYDFDVPSLNDAQAFTLRSRYKDGFSAFLNGQPLEHQNAPEVLQWNSTALERRDGSDIDEYVNSYQIDQQLQAGRNVLAIQGLTESVISNAAFFQFEIAGLGSVAESAAYLTSPSPGIPNVVGGFDFVDDVEFSQDHGFYDDVFNLTLTSATADAKIYFTTDGSAPTTDHGSLYENPIEISGTTIVRAVATKEGLADSATETQSYIFVKDAISQSDQDAAALGFPIPWGSFDPGRWPNREADYEMDTTIIGPNDQFGGKYADRVEEGLRSIPSLSIVMDVDDVFGPTGIYQDPRNAGIDWERPTSVELIHPDGTEGFQIDAGIRIQGGASRFISQKQSFRLLFKDDYGPSKLNYPFFGPTAADTFDSITLRSSTGEYLLRNSIHYIRDEALRRSQLASGNLSSQGTYVHLYINGLYWGLYNPVERVDGQFAANYLGGEKEDYDVLNAGDAGENTRFDPLQGTADAWNRLMNLTEQIGEANTQAEKTRLYLQAQGLNPDGTRNPEFEVLLDAQNYADYLITQVYSMNYDWPVRNYIFLRDRTENSTGFKFLTWDGEFTLDSGVTTRGSFTTVDAPPPNGGPLDIGVGILYQGLKTSDEFLTEISDRIQQQIAPGGALYVAPEVNRWDPDHPQLNVPGARYAELVEIIQTAIIAESARWGDQQVIYYDGSPLNPVTMTPDERWQPVVDFNLNRFFPARTGRFVSRATADDHYRPAPTITETANGPDAVHVTLANNFRGSLYYTLDGTDPKLPDGSISASAVEYAGEIALTEKTNVMARALDGTKWSSIADSTVFSDVVPGGIENLRISEINYHPHDALTELGEPDLEGETFEFIEIENITGSKIDLQGIRLVSIAGSGIAFEFGAQTLDAFERVVVPANVAAFAARYGTDVLLAIGVAESADDWSYTGFLGNGGDLVTLQDGLGRTIQQFSYDDNNGWPGRADGGASTLEIIDTLGDYEDPSNYRNSSEFGGSPGTEGKGPDKRVVVNEVSANTDQPTLDQIELLNRSITSVDISGWYLSDSQNNYMQFKVPDNTVLQMGAYAVFNETQLGFGLNSVDGDDVYLLEADENGFPTRFVNHIEFRASENGISFGRWPNGSGRIYPMQETTIGKLNSGPRQGDVVITEIQYDPGDPDGKGDLTETSMEYIEIYNRTEAEVDLSHWHLRGDSDFDFPEGITLAAGEIIVLVKFDPATDLIDKVNFNLLFSTSIAATLMGPIEGDLGNLSGDIRLYKPETPRLDDPDNIPYVLVDEVEYATDTLWPDAINGDNVSINRIDPAAFGNDGRNWTGNSETPGVVDFTKPVVGDFTDDRVVDADDVDAICSAIHGGVSLNEMDLNQDGSIDRADLDQLIQDILRTGPGDGNLDGQFDSSDLILAFVAGEYDDAVANNSTWRNGDWDCDREFSSSDLVHAFVENNYVSPPAVNEGLSSSDVQSGRGKDDASESNQEPNHQDLHFRSADQREAVLVHERREVVPPQTERDLHIGKRPLQFDLENHHDEQA